LVSRHAGHTLDRDSLSTQEDGVVTVRSVRTTSDRAAAAETSSVQATDALVGLPARYEIGSVIGRGGTSRVYSAVDRDLGREVAIKVIRVGNPAARERYAREGRVMASLGHPNILPIYDVGTTSDSIYFTMPLFTGRSLGSMIRAASRKGHTEVLAVPTLVEIALKICDALGYAHARGVVHRDIKPDNVLIGDFGEVMVVDWGAAAAPQANDGGGPRVVGTPAYMSPEQVHGHDPTPRSDVYALGATLFHALLLRRSLPQAAAAVFWRRKLAGDFDPPTPAELSRGRAFRARDVRGRRLPEALGEPGHR
jgi:serine/threonine protein kinase